IAAVIICSVVGSLTSTQLDVVADRAICLVKNSIGGGSCAPATTTPPPTTDPSFDPKPAKCKITEHSEKVNSEIKIAFVKIGENAGFVET
ncbi:hypothetical protein QOZ75_29540, partial [Pseudomonas aeruginosa]|uniref:hypothetical protein n=1 Tax=Pseudomonas aeruginosa TaxID=287 RepID=UPI003458847C